jgi:hypothetical protein
MYHIRLSKYASSSPTANTSDEADEDEDEDEDGGEKEQQIAASSACSALARMLNRFLPSAHRSEYPQQSIPRL